MHPLNAKSFHLLHFEFFVSAEVIMQTGYTLAKLNYTLTFPH